jgi:arylsulfatase A-like enzyme
MRRFILLALILVSGVSLSTAADRPNLVLIMADDMGYGDVSCYADPGYETPNVDRLAAEGLKFTDFHSSGPVCSPTRAGLVTGRYQQRAGIDGVIYADPRQNRHHGLQSNEITFANCLSDAGYATAIFGKWHLGYETQYNPVRRGFDQFRGYVSGNVCYIAHLDRMGIADWWQDDQLVPEEGYVTHLVTQHAIEFIETHRDEPFCCYVAHECVHAPYQGPDDPPVRREGTVGDIRSASRKDIPNAYREMMIEMDRGVGEIIDTLKRLGIAENTLVLFFSDNGGTPHGNNGPLRGFKGSLWEGGHRVPAIAWQPGTIEPGRVTDVPAISIDMMPTMLDLAGTSAPDGRNLDGISLAPVLHNDGELPDRKLFWAYRNRFAVRDGKWKLVDESGKPQLFDLSEDLGEQHDLAAEQPARAASMQAAYRQWRADIDASATPQPTK